MLEADTTLTAFFPLQSLAGSIEKVLQHPGSIAVSRQFAIRCFGTTDCIGQSLELFNGEEQRCVVEAVFARNEQGILPFDLLLPLGASMGVDCMLLLKPDTDREAFRQRLEATKLPTLLGEGYYRALTLQESYFDTTLQESNQLMEHRQKVLLSVGLFSALLVLLIGCFNYVNLSLSRLLGQVRMFRVEVLSGATSRQIRKQLFADILLMLSVAFLLSCLLMNDLLPLFNRVLSARLTFGYLFSWQVLPVLLLPVLLFLAIPAWYVGRRLHTLTESNYRTLFTGRGKHMIIGSLLTLQFLFSIGLLSAFSVIGSQLRMIEQEGMRYADRIEIAGDDSLQPSVRSGLEEVRRMPGVVAATVSSSGFITNSIAIPGDEQLGYQLVMMQLYDECLDFLTLYQLELQDSVHIRQLMKSVPNPVLVNEAFVRLFVPAGENPVGQSIFRYVPRECGGGEIVGVLKDCKMSMKQAAAPLRMLLHEEPQDGFSTLVVQATPGQKEAVISRLCAWWEERYPQLPFQPTDIFAQYDRANHNVTDFSYILLMYAVISLLLTLFGLLGIARYAIGQRKRELAIRRVYGASPSQLLQLLCRPFLGYILVAFALSAPLVYLLITRWLEQFVYHVHPTLADFLLPLFLTLLFTLLVVVICCRSVIRNR